MILIKSISIVDRVGPGLRGGHSRADCAFAEGLDTEGDWPGPLPTTAGRDTLLRLHRSQP